MIGIRPLTLAFAGAALFATGAAAQSAQWMLDDCAALAQKYFGDFEARSEMQYNGRRVDGTHAINGRIFLETRYEDFACSFDRTGRKMTEFFVEGRLQNAYLPGGTTEAGNGKSVAVRGVPANDVLNVRGGPGTNYRIVGALANGDRVHNLGCEAHGKARWCHIEMMSDMRERGWVNARYLDLGTAAQKPGKPQQSDAFTQRVRFEPGTTGAEMTGFLAPGESRRYILNARNGQFLYFRLAARGQGMSYQIFNPDRSFLLTQMPARQEYRGQLWQTGDHVVEVINRGSRTQTYNVIFGID